MPQSAGKRVTRTHARLQILLDGQDKTRSLACSHAHTRKACTQIGCLSCFFAACCLSARQADWLTARLAARDCSAMRNPFFTAPQQTAPFVVCSCVLRPSACARVMEICFAYLTNSASCAHHVLLYGLRSICAPLLLLLSACIVTLLLLLLLNKHS